MKVTRFKEKRRKNLKKDWFESTYIDNKWILKVNIEMFFFNSCPNDIDHLFNQMIITLWPLYVDN